MCWGFYVLFRSFGKLLAHELQERFVPDAPVAVEILFAVPGFVILAADEPLHAGRTGIGAETHRAALRTAEKRRGVTFVAQEMCIRDRSRRPTRRASPWYLRAKGISSTSRALVLDHAANYIDNPPESPFEKGDFG